MREIVIKLSDEEYEALQRASYYSFDKYTAYIAMKSGTPLPKGHGRLIDADDLLDANIDTFSQQTELKIKFAPTIIEADKEE